MYQVVSDVQAYAEFVPYCTRSFINQRDAAGQPTEAGLRVGWKQFDEEFVCELQCSPEHHVVVAQSLTHSLFHKLYTKWTIRPNSRANACDVELVLKYRFKSDIYNAVSSVFAESVSGLVMNSFEKRAAHLRRAQQRAPAQKET